MSSAPMTPLRQRMIEDMSIRQFGERLARVRKEDRLPEVLSPEEVALLLHCAPSLKHKAALSVAFGCGLRVSEITHLLERKTDVRVIQAPLGHKKLDTTARYTRVAIKTLSPAEFIRRFLIHVLPSGSHRIRHYGLLAKGPNAVPLETLRALILERTPQPASVPEQAPKPREPKAPPALVCLCGGGLRIIEVIGRGGAWRARALAPLWCDSSSARPRRSSAPMPAIAPDLGAGPAAPRVQPRLKRRPATANVGASHRSGSDMLDVWGCRGRLLRSIWPPPAPRRQPLSPKPDPLGVLTAASSPEGFRKPQQLQTLGRSGKATLVR